MTGTNLYPDMEQVRKNTSSKWEKRKGELALKAKAKRRKELISKVLFVLILAAIVAVIILFI